MRRRNDLPRDLSRAQRDREVVANWMGIAVGAFLILLNLFLLWWWFSL